jgi:hypothetical protein
VEKRPGEEYAMDLDYSDYEYLAECTDGCGEITDWLPSKDTACEAANNHAKQNGHKWIVQQRIKDPKKKGTERVG